MALGYGHASRLTRYIIRTPRWYNSVIFAVLAGGVAGLGGFGDGIPAALEGVLFIGLPAVGAAFMTTPIDRYHGGQMTWNRSAFLAILCEGIAIVLVPTAAFAHKYLGFGDFVIDALVTSLALAFGLRFLVLMAVSRDSVVRTVIPASVQTVVGAAVLFAYTGLFDPISEVYFQNLVITSTVYVVGAYAFVRLVDRPIKDGMGVSGLELLRGFIAYISEGTRELEEIFEEMGEHVIVPVTVLSFRTSDTKQEKARFVLPMAHPGIIGEIGGGNLPLTLAEASPSTCFVPHATADHDFNPVSQREVDRLRVAVDEAIENVEYTDEATPSRRLKVGDTKMIGQRFGDSVMLGTTCSPHSCDDIRFGVGLNAITESRVEGAHETMLIDAHNCCFPNSGMIIDPGSARSYNLTEASGRLTDGLFDEETAEISLGVASSPTRWTRDEGMGPLGIRVAVVEVGGQTTAYVVIDGNNMVPTLRERIIDSLDVDEAEVMTTDTHIVNRVESHNMIGEHIDHDELAEVVRELVDEARDDLEPVEAGMGSSEARIVVFGNDRIERLATTTNAVASVGGALAVMATFVALLLSVLVFLFN